MPAKFILAGKNNGSWSRSWRQRVEELAAEVGKKSRMVLWVP
jgi:hypothetical protein